MSSKSVVVFNGKDGETVYVVDHPTSVIISLVTPLSRDRSQVAEIEMETETCLNAGVYEVAR